MSSIKAPTQCPHKSKIHAFPPKGIISLQYLNHAPHIESTEKKNTAIDQPTPKRRHPNPVYNPDSKSLPASVAGTRSVKCGDASAALHRPPPGTLPNSTLMARSSSPHKAFPTTEGHNTNKQTNT